MTIPNDILDGRGAADELLAYVLGAPLAKVLDLSTPAGFDRAVTALAARLRAVAAGDERRAVREAIAVLDVDWPRTTAAERRQLVAEAMRRAGQHIRAVPSRLDAPLGDAAMEVVSATRTVSRRRHRLAIGVEMNALDRRIVRHVTRSQALFVMDAYGRRLEELGVRAKEIVAAGLEAGHARTEIAEALAAAAEGALTGRSRFYWEVVAGAFVGRARSFAQVSSYAEAGVERYRVQAVLDEATCLTGETAIRSRRGAVRIADLIPGDEVWTHRGRWRPVLATKKTFGPRAGRTVTIAGSSIRATVNHRFLVMRAGTVVWLRADQLKVGDKLFRRRVDGEEGPQE